MVGNFFSAFAKPMGKKTSIFKSLPEILLYIHWVSGSRLFEGSAKTAMVKEKTGARKRKALNENNPIDAMLSSAA
jgi:hypothetical protein